PDVQFLASVLEASDRAGAPACPGASFLLFSWSLWCSKIGLHLLPAPVVELAGPSLSYLRKKAPLYFSRRARKKNSPLWRQRLKTAGDAQVTSRRIYHGRPSARKLLRQRAKSSAGSTSWLTTLD